MENSTRADFVFSKMRQAIISGEWRPSEKIPSEHALCERYNVSRVSVRSAISKLSLLGLVESKQGKGNFVCVPTENKQLDLLISQLFFDEPDRMSVFEFRAILETESAALAAVRANGQLVDQLRTINQTMRESTCIEEITQCDKNFHALIAEATQNPFIIKVSELLSDIYMRHLKGNVAVMGAEGAIAHEKIILAIELRTPSVAKKAMEEHLKHTVECTTRYLREKEPECH